MCTQLYHSLNRLSIIQANDARLLAGRKKAPASWSHVLVIRWRGILMAARHGYVPPPLAIDIYVTVYSVAH